MAGPKRQWEPQPGPLPALAPSPNARRAEAERRRREHEAAAGERARIARKLHDVIAHSVTVMVRQAEEAAGMDEDLDSPTMLGPQPCVDDVPALVERMRAAGHEFRLLVEGDPRPMDRAGHLAAYRLVQEGLTNVAKHAGPGAEARCESAGPTGCCACRCVTRGPTAG